MDAVTDTLDGTAAATRPQLVIFDLDGTLTDSAAGHRRQLPPRARRDRRRRFPTATWPAGSSGPPMHHTLRGMGLGDHADAAIAAYRADYTTRGWAMNSLFDGIPQLLADLRAAGVRLAVATSKAEPTARRILAHFGLDEHFEVIAGASLDGVRATKAEVVAHALAQLEPLPERVVMVGDRAHDVEGAAAHGIDTVVVGWGYGAADFAEPAAVAALPRHVATGRRLREVLGVSGSEPLHVTFVCSGNICRSPMAEKMFAHQISERGLADEVRVTSAGTGDWHAGEGADNRANHVLREHGYPTEHRAGGSTTTTCRPTWWWRWAATTCGYCAIWAFRPTGCGCCGRSTRGRVRTPLDVEDPYYGTHDDFEDVFTVIEAALPGLHDWVDEQLARPRSMTARLMPRWRSCCGRAGSPCSWWSSRSPICASPCWRRGSSARTPRPRGRTHRSPGR